ncbi:nucleotidyltransferase family protein [Psychrobacillus sp. INOP01]|uniref:nucleotidyltransferase family protein n=1 Tax=Psychrobacillus sp. INOP01 TaxID=2829187 RepID=UPI001BAA1AE2|nr:nucleotidyltransferase family protein [Psychrobacillus sp. INOP01]QUG41335.1 nucleotidyltransferase family protein [Psychrobacillus sp. INOP01]
MVLQTREDIKSLIQEDKWMMDILKVAHQLELPDWWICAGFVRSKIWDTLHGYIERTPLADIDVIYFDSNNKEESEEKKWEDQLQCLLPNIPWSVKNQARMHKINSLPPYISSVDGIANFPETVTAIGVKLDEQNEVVLVAPHGIADILQMSVNPVPRFATNKDLLEVYEQRIQNKNWLTIWPNVRIVSRLM